jgi:hypothetical protein
MKRHKRSIVIVAIVLIGSLMANLLWRSGSNVVHAENIPLTYDTDSFWAGYSYSKYPTLTPTNTVTKDGYKIKSLKVVNYSNNDVVKSIDSAVGKTSYSLGAADTMNGIQARVSSMRNETTKGYYAWYRYSKASGDMYWHANFNRVDDSYNEYGDSRTSKSSVLDETGMPAHPGTIDSSLSLTGGREKAFYTDNGQWIDGPYISHDELTGSVTVNEVDVIDGPSGEGLSGKASAAKISNYTVDAFPDLNRIVVRYTQKFDYFTEASKPLEAYGAALMVYFSAFTVDLVSNTYHYPYELQVEWDPLITSAPPSSPTSPMSSPTPTPAPFGITGDFDPIPSSITYRDSFTLRPKNIVVTGAGCTYTKHEFKIERNGFTNYTGDITGKTTDLTYGYDNYRSMSAVGVGSNQISMRVFSSCGDSGWIGPKTLTITSPPNDPPYAKIAWFYPWDTSTPISEVWEGDAVQLRIWEDPLSNPPSPSDPDGDTVDFNWNFAGSASAWVRSLPTSYHFDSTHEWAYFGIKATQPGTHSIRMTAVDTFGGDYTASAFLTVKTTNPKPVIRGPAEVVEDRPLPSPFHANDSYSPVSGRTIDHSRDEWTNKQGIYNEPGTYVLTLEVTDNTGLHSHPDEKATQTLTVKPDLPPIPDLVHPSRNIRNNPVLLRNSSYSPDGDTLNQNSLTYQYDSNNNGNYDDETSIALSNEVNFNADKVGKYRFKVYAKENWGREASKFFYMEVVNQEPSVTFTLSSTVAVPFVITSTSINPNDVINGSWKASNYENSDMFKKWRSSNGELSYVGSNNFSPYRGGTTLTNYSSTKSDPITNDQPHRRMIFDRQGNKFEVAKVIVDGREFFGVVKKDSNGNVVNTYSAFGWNAGYAANRSTPEIFQIAQNRDENRLAFTVNHVYIFNPPPFVHIVDQNLNSLATIPNHILVASDSERIYTNYSSRTYAYDYNGQLLWSVSGESGFGVASNNGYLYFQNAGNLNVVDVRTGTLLQTLYPSIESSCGQSPAGLNLYDSGILQASWYACGDSSSQTYVYLYKPNSLDSARNLLSQSNLWNTDLQLSNFDLSFQMKLRDVPQNMMYSGYSFKVQDNRNMYRVETDGGALRLVKVVNGSASLLSQYPTSFMANTYYSIRIKSVGNRHIIYLGGVPVIDVTDHSWSSGSFGPFAEVPGTTFRNMTYTDLNQVNTGSLLTAGKVLAGAAADYSKTFTDPESDPGISAKETWKYEQVNHNMLDAGDGLYGWSAHHGQSYNSTVGAFDKVGTYKVTHWSYDDPHPSYRYPSSTFDGYRQESNRYEQYLIVHRKPAARFSAWINGDGTVGWDDTSYDPDRWLNAWTYSTESSDYESNRGIYGRKYRYTSPGGSTVAGKLVRPTENGAYTLGLAVQDEYGVWSDWTEQTVNATVQFPANNPPQAAFGSPDTVYRDTWIQLSNTSSDPDGDPLTYQWTAMKPGYTNNFSIGHQPGFRVRDYGLGKNAVSDSWSIQLTVSDSKDSAAAKRTLKVVNQTPYTSINGLASVKLNETHRYTSGAGDADSEDGASLQYQWRVTKPSGEVVPNTAVYWDITFTEGGTYTLEHWVIDQLGAESAISRLEIFVDANKPPVPGFTFSPNPTYRWNTVTIVSTASDPDGIIASHEYYIKDPTGVEWFHSNNKDWTGVFGTVGNWTIRQKVTDNRGVTAEVSQILTIYNRVPTVTLNIPSGVDADHPSVNIPPFRATWTYQDEDNDPQAHYYFQIFEYGSNQKVYEYWGTPSGNAFHDVPAGYLTTGKLYYAIVQGHDGSTWSGTSAPKFLTLNRPPAANFDWLPKPVWEGDTIRLFSTSTDPDGQALTYQWTIQTPSGNVMNGGNEQWEGLFSEPGTYQVRLEVSDGYAADSMTKGVAVLPLTINADVLHTPEWLEHHRSKGHQTELVPKDFYSGERLWVSLVSAAAPVAEAEAWLDAECADGEMLHITSELLSETSRPDTFLGELYDGKLGTLTGRLPNGEHIIHFRLLYANGVEKLQDVPIRIIGSVHQAVQVHRVQ